MKIRIIEAERPIVSQAEKIAATGERALTSFTSGLLGDGNSIMGAATPTLLARLTYALSQMVFGMSKDGAVMLGTAAFTGQITKRWQSGKSSGTS